MGGGGETHLSLVLYKRLETKKRKKVKGKKKDIKEQSDRQPRKRGPGMGGEARFWGDAQGGIGHVKEE